jgi:hypothetical protein
MLYYFHPPLEGEGRLVEQQAGWGERRFVILSATKNFPYENAAN